MRPLFVVFLTVTLDLVGWGIVIPLLPFYAQEFGASPLEVTLLMGSYSLAQFLGAPWWGRLSDRFGRRPVMLVSIAATAISLALFATAPSLVLLFVYRSLHGFAAANIGIAQACVADLTTPETRARGMGLVGAGYGVGFTLGPALGGVLSSFGLSVPLLVAAGLSVVNLGLASLVLPETRHPGSMRSTRTIVPGALWRTLMHPTVGGVVATLGMQVMAFAAMESCLALLAKARHGYGPRDIGWLLVAVGTVSVVVQAGLLGRVVRRYGEGRAIAWGLAIFGLSLLLMAVVPGGWPFVGALSLAAVGQGLANPSLTGLISRRTATDVQGEALGAAQSVAALGRAIAPAIAGALYTNVAPGAPYVAAGMWLWAAAALAPFLTAPRTRGEPIAP